MPIWKDIPGYEGIYQVSDMGLVRSVDRMSSNGKKLSGKNMSVQKDALNYRRIRLRKDGVSRTEKVHRLVLLSFIGVSDDVVDHINGNPSDNRLVNLRYVSSRQNAIYANHRRRLNQSSSYLGVYFCKNVGKYRSKIYINGKSHHIGLFKSEVDAHNAYLTRLKEAI